jgi:hypothetical protein
VKGVALVNLTAVGVVREICGPDAQVVLPLVGASGALLCLVAIAVLVRLGLLRSGRGRREAPVGLVD